MTAQKAMVATEGRPLMVAKGAMEANRTELIMDCRYIVLQYHCYVICSVDVAYRG